MKRVFKLGVAGSHSTGKTTFIETLERKLVALGFAIGKVKDLAAEAREIGFPILYDHTFDSTAWIITRGISEELAVALKADVVLVDRPVPDALGYLRAALKWRSSSLEGGQEYYLEEVVRLHVPSYNRLLLTSIDPSIPLDLSKDRDDNLEFRRMAEDGIGEVFGRLSVPFTHLPSTGRDQIIASIVEEIVSWRGTARP